MSKEKKKSEVRSGSKQKKQEQGALGKIGQSLRNLRDFFDLSIVEMKKVTWPSRKDTTVTCVAVVIMVIVVGAYLALVDFGASRLIEAVLAR